MRKYVHGWCIAVSLYFLTLFFTSLISYALYGTLATDYPTLGAIFSGLMLLVVPYAFIGLYARSMFSKTTKAAFWLSISFWIGEKVAFLLFAIYGAGNSPKPMLDYETIVQYLHLYSFPFYNYIYLGAGLISIIISVYIASRPYFQKKRTAC